MSLALGQPKVALVQVWIALEQEPFWGLSSPRPKRLFAPSLVDFRGNPGIRALCQAIGLPNRGYSSQAQTTTRVRTTDVSHRSTSKWREKSSPQISRVEIPRKALHLHDFFRKVQANFCLLPSDMGQEPNENCSKTFSDEPFSFGCFRVDFPPLINFKTC